MSDAADLVAHARRTRVVVIGEAGAAAAWECAKVGFSVTLVGDDSEEDVDVDGFAAGHPALADLLAPGGISAAGLHDSLVPVSAGPTWLSHAAVQAPLPSPALLGIPANPWDASVRRLIGWPGTWRAYLDRIRPPLTVGRERNLGALVRARMGDRVAERLVAPVTRSRWGLDPEDIDVEAAAPGLNAALTRTGSLGGGVDVLAGDAPPRSVFRDGGAAWREALTARLSDLSADVRRDDRVRRLSRREGGWVVELDPAAGEGPAVIEAEAVILATWPARLRELLAGIVAFPEPSPTPARDVVRFRLRTGPAPWVRFLPGGPGRASDPGRVLRIVDVTAAIPHREGVTDGEDARLFHVEFVGSEAGDDDVIAAARNAVAAAIGRPVGGADVVGAERIRVNGVVTAARLGGAAERAAILDAIGKAGRGSEGLEVTGRWLCGGGFADAVADAIAAADRVRRHALWDGVAG